MEYVDYVTVLQASHPELASDLADSRGLGSVMRWMRLRGIPLGCVEIIQQDEFALDFVIPLKPDGTHLVFGIT
jgi:hypothetical protein